MSELGTLLACQSFFSEGRSTVSPRRLVERAASRGYGGVGLADWCSLAGAVELCAAARETGLRAVVGVTLPVVLPAPSRSREAPPAFPLVLLAASRRGYTRLCELLTRVRRDGAPLSFPAFQEAAGAGPDLVCLTGGRAGFPTVLGEQRELARAAAGLMALRPLFPAGLYVQLYHGQAPHERRRLEYLRGLARDLNLPVVAAPEVCMADPEDFPLLDALCCARLGTDVSTPHPERPRNDARHVGTPADWGRLLPFPDALLNAEKLGHLCALDLLPGPESSQPSASQSSATPPASPAQQALDTRARAALSRYPAPERAAAEARLNEELGTVAGLDLAGFFLTAAEIADYCHEHGILAAGRGSAAGSVLCYLLGITLSDPLRHDLLFERFLHAGREVMPDVDLDIASSRRDQVLAWVEERFGTRAGAGEGEGEGEAMVARRVTYRLPSAVQDLGRALGLPPGVRDRLTRSLGRDFRHHRPHRAREAQAAFSEVLGGAPVEEALLGLLSRMERGFVRHLAPHSGGVVLGALLPGGGEAAGGGRLTQFSPLSRSSGGIRMLEFDKDDLEKLGLMKLDLLGLRMLACLERAREEVLRLTGEWLPYGELPDDPAVWRELSSGDTLGLFQIESPAQVQMTARLQPHTLEALAHQIALVRPGPIQSGTVHPYVRRARGEEPVPDWMGPLRSILAPTHGTLLFQEQILRIAVRYAGYSWPQADRFRAELGRAEDEADLAALRGPFVSGAALTVGAFPDEAQEVFGMCAAFRGYGFAESHAHAFAAHAYASAYVRHHHPAAYFAAFLTEAPGLWPAQTVAREAARRGVKLDPVDINRSGLNYRAAPRSIRVPLCAVEGVSAQAARTVVQERLTGGKFTSVQDCYDRVPLRAGVLEALVKAGAFDRLEGLGSRRRASYVLRTLAQARPPGTRALLGPQAAAPELPTLTPDEEVWLDLRAKGVTETGRHPLDAHRARLRDLGCAPLSGLRHGEEVWAAGLVVLRQRPPTARGFAFYVLEDATGRAQAVISPDLWEAHRALLRDARALVVRAVVARRGRAVTLRVLSLAELPLGRSS